MQPSFLVGSTLIKLIAGSTLQGMTCMFHLASTKRHFCLVATPGRTAFSSEEIEYNCNFGVRAVNVLFLYIIIAILSYIFVIVCISIYD